jgi:hypothetical protein
MYDKNKKQHSSVKKEDYDPTKMYVVLKPMDNLDAAGLIKELNPLEGLQPLGVDMQSVHSVHSTADEAQQIAAEVYGAYVKEVQALEEKKGKVSHELRKTIDLLEKKRKDHLDMAKQNPKNASQYKNDIAKIATQIDDLMSKMERIEKSKKLDVDKEEDKKDKKPIKENSVNSVPVEVVKTGTYEIRKTPKGDYTNPDGTIASFFDDKYSLYLDGQEIGDSVYAGGAIQKAPGIDFTKMLRKMGMGEKPIKENKDKYTIGDKIVGSNKVYFIYNNDTGTQSGSYKTKEEAQKELNKKKDKLEERMNPTDKISLDVPLFIRLLEYAREDAKSDMDLHNIAEKAIALSQSGMTLSMNDYESIVGQQEQIAEAENVVDSIPEIQRYLKDLATKIPTVKGIDTNEVKGIVELVNAIINKLGKGSIGPSIKATSQVFNQRTQGLK